MALFILLICLVGTFATAQDVLPQRLPFPIPPMPPIAVKLPVMDNIQPVQVTDVAIEANVDGVLTETKVTMTLHNPNGRVLEGELNFPLPAGATTAIRQNTASDEAAEIESEKKIEDALKKLRPAGSPPEGKETAKIIYLEFGFAPPTEKIVIDLENEKISYEFSYTIGKIGKEGYKKREIPPKTVKALKAKLAGFSTARWEDRYSAPHVRDGTQWQLEITFSDGSSRMISGSNAWPKDFNRLGIGEIRKKARDEAKP